MIRNYYLLVGVILTILAIIGIGFYIIPKQYTEVRSWTDNSSLNTYRILILITECFIVFSMIPGLPRSIQAINIPAANNYAKVAAISNRVSYFGIMILLVLLYRFRIEE